MIHKLFSFPFCEDKVNNCSNNNFSSASIAFFFFKSGILAFVKFGVSAVVKSYNFKNLI